MAMTDAYTTNAKTQTDDVAYDSTAADGTEHNIPLRTLGNTKVPYAVLQLIPEESARHYSIAPLALVDGVLEVGMVDPDNLGAVDALNFITRKTGTPFKTFQINQEDFEKIVTMYKGLGGDVDRALTDLRSEEDTDKEKEEAKGIFEENAVIDLNDPDIAPVQDSKESYENSLREDAPAIKLVSTILRYAIDGGASDVHIEPVEQGVRVRYRVDGVLHTSVVLPTQTLRALVARVKVLASIRLDERRKPQDGRFSASFDGRKVDFRVSTFPTYNGEKVVIRILDRQQNFIKMDDLGLSEENLKTMKDAIKQPHGLILISGPTGSGKSTTLYSMLAEIDREQKNVLSLEDPVEYYMDGVSQSQVRPDIGYTFANGLRTTLRQDPDVIMVGEIRDGETAKLAIQAALTGHLVLSTIHTNSAVGTIPRLIDMGVEPYLIPPTLVVSIAQRLVRTLCPDGGEQVALTDSRRRLVEQQFATLNPSLRPPIPEMVYEAKRTPTCPTGMRGRMAVFEVLKMSPGVERAVLESGIESKIWAEARREGMMTMKESAFMQSFAGKIPFTEAEALSGLLLDEEDAIEALAETPPVTQEQPGVGVQNPIEKQPSIEL